MPRGKKTIPDAWRAKIQATQLVNRLSDFVGGKIDLSPAQVTAALGLLKKVAPDLKSIEMKGFVTDSHDDFVKSLGEDKPSQV